MMRSSVWLALLECSVLRHRWPVSRENDRMLHGFGIADFADEDHIGGLAQRVLERVVPSMRVEADVAMRDQGLLRLVNEFDRIFDGDDVSRRERLR